MKVPVMFVALETVLVLLVTAGVLCSAEEPPFLTDVELTSSHYWNEEGAKLFLIKRGVGDATLPAEVVTFMRESLAGLPLTTLQVVCEEESVSQLCSLFTSHQAVVRRDGDLVGLEPYSQLRDRQEYLNHVLELAIGEAIIQVDSYSSLMSVFGQHPESFLALLLNTSSTEYTSLLSSYLSLQATLPLVLTSSKESLPLPRRPHLSSRTQPLYLYNVRGGGEDWYPLFSLKQIEKFLLRAQHPAIVHLTGGIGKYQKASLHLVVLFPGLPGQDQLDLEQLLKTVAEKLYLSFIFVIANRRQNKALADKLIANDNIPRPVAFLLPYGKDTEYYLQEVVTDTMETEVIELAAFLQWKAEEIEREGAGGKGPEIITDLKGIDRLMKKTNMVVAFCGEDDPQCPGDAYFAMDDARKVFARSRLDIPYQLFVVQCDSVAEISKYELSFLPCYALYNRDKKTWSAGYEGPTNHRDILSLLATETGHSELLTIPTGIDGIQQEMLYSHFENRRPDGDIYRELGSSIPAPSLPSELVLTDKNFREKISSSERTLVLFYLHWSVENTMVLHHLLAADERLDKSANVSVAALDCHAHTMLCQHYNATILPTVLLFTPSTLDTPSPLPRTVSTLDSTHFLQALGQLPEETGLIEVTPASLPTLLRNDLTTPLVLWCADNTSSELAAVFADIALEGSEMNEGLSFGWINSSSSTLSSDLPTVVAMHLPQRAVYQMDSVYQLQADSFRQQLLDFLDQLRQGRLKPTKRQPRKKWRPLHPPFQFPSSQREEEREEDPGMMEGARDMDPGMMEGARDMDPGMMEGMGDIKQVRREDGRYEVRGKLDLEGIPLDEPPQVMDYPMYEDNSHEEAWGQEAGQEELWQEGVGQFEQDMNRDEL